MHSEWIWELRSSDLHVVNRSESGFSTREACLLDADRCGFTLGKVVKGSETVPE